MPRRAFFSRNEGQGRPLGTVSFHLGDVSPDRQTDRERQTDEGAAPLHRPRLTQLREGSEEEGCGWQLARKAHARLVLRCQGCTLPTSVQLQKRCRHTSRLADRPLGNKISGR